MWLYIAICGGIIVAFINSFLKYCNNHKVRDLFYPNSLYAWWIYIYFCCCYMFTGPTVFAVHSISVQELVICGVVVFLNFLRERTHKREKKYRNIFGFFLSVLSHSSTVRLSSSYLGLLSEVWQTRMNISLQWPILLKKTTAEIIMNLKKTPLY